MIVFDDDALADLERIFAFNQRPDVAHALRELGKIQRAVMILDEHPHIGRPVDGELRELVISVGKAGYDALYQHDELDELVRVLAVRHQREGGYRRGR